MLREWWHLFGFVVTPPPPTVRFAPLFSGTVTLHDEPPAPKMPMDYAWAKQLGLIRKPAAFVSSISDDRGEELTYAGGWGEGRDAFSCGMR